VAPAQASDFEALALPAGMTGATVLVAGNNGYTTALGRALSQGGFDVITAVSVGQMLDLAAQHHPDLVITAEKLRDGAGSAVCQALKREGDYIPVILLAGADDRLALDDPDTAPDAILPCPVDLASLSPILGLLLRLKLRFDRRTAQLVAEAREIEALKEQIISNVSHELRTPLLQVKSAISLLAEQLGRQPSIGPHNMADMATIAVARLEGIVGNIRQLAQTHEVRLGPVSVAEAADLAMRTMTRSWESRRAEARVAVQVDRNLAPVVADKRALGHLLQLLIDNALKFSDESAPVYVIAERAGEREVWIGVQDFGIGIAPEEHGRIFDAFYQVDGSATRSQGGTGTGLALALLLATSMHTRIAVASQPSRGSTFSFTLPVADLNHAY
jgi:signal transduction histidine kinase